MLLGGEILENLAIKELLRSKEENRILTGKISGIENEFYKLRQENIDCAVIWYNEIKVLISSYHLGITKINKSIIRGMLGAEIDFIIIDIDTTSNVAIASRKKAMELRAELELPKLKINDVARVRIIAVGIKHIICELYGKEVVIRAENLQHTYIVNCKDKYFPGEYLKVRIKNIDLENNIFELDAKCFLENPYNYVRKYITEGGEYTGQVIAFPKNNSGVIVQLDSNKVTCLVRIPAKFNSFPHYMQKVLIKITEIKQDKKLIYGYLVRII